MGARLSEYLDRKAAEVYGSYRNPFTVTPQRIL